MHSVEELNRLKKLFDDNEVAPKQTHRGFLECNGLIRLFPEDIKHINEITGVNPSYIRSREQLHQLIKTHKQLLETDSTENLIHTMFLEPYLSL